MQRDDTGGRQGVAQAAPDPQAAFARLLEQYGPALRRLCCAYMADPSDRADLAQEIAMALWTALPRYRGEASERTWLYRIAHNVALTYSSRARRHGRVLDTGENALDALPAADNVEAQAAWAERLRQLRAEVTVLPVADRRLVLLYLEGLTAAETALVLGIGEANVATRLSRLRRELARRLHGRGVKS